jgi:hypothetical protein
MQGDDSVQDSAPQDDAPSTDEPDWRADADAALNDSNA